MAEVMLKERAISFGEGGRLLGILTLPTRPNIYLPTVVIPNTGIDHRVGPNRLHVQLARALAAAGYSTLRFDVGGLGDSDPPPGQGPDSSRDLQAAIDALTARQLGPGFLLIGVCSGAHDIHQFAKNSTVVTGALFIDGYAYPTARFKRRRLMQRLLRVHAKATETIPRLLGASETPTPESMPSFFATPPIEEVAADFDRMLKRGINMAFLFTGDIESVYNYEEQHYDSFPELRDWAQIWYRPEIDHTLTRRKAREALIALIRGWVVHANPVDC